MLGSSRPLQVSIGVNPSVPGRNKSRIKSIFSLEILFSAGFYKQDTTDGCDNAIYVFLCFSTKTYGKCVESRL